MSARLQEALAPGADEARYALRAAARPRPFADRRITVESFPPEAAETHLAAWRDLADRALEPNVFMDPAFAAPAAVHLPSSRRPEFVAVWEGIGFETRGRMIALAALQSRPSMLTRGLALGWLHPHAALGAPLVDRRAAARAIDALFDWVANDQRGWTGLVLPRLVREGPLFEMLVARAVAADRPWSAGALFQRAVLRNGKRAEGEVARVASKKRLKEHNRLFARLGERGRVEIRSVSDPSDIRRELEVFLALESTGWKGRRGTSLLSNAADAAFTRVMARLMARRAKCRIDSLTLDGRPLAMAILMESGGRSYFWKTAYDESFAAYSPGALLARALVDRQLARPGIDLTDSCAVADHPMIDRIWPDRQAMADFEICCAPKQARAFHAAIRRRSTARRLRASAKQALARAFGRRVS